MRFLREGRFLAGAVTVASLVLAVFAMPSSAAAKQGPECEGRHSNLDLNRAGKTFGTKRADVIVGNRGANRIFGLRGNDRICGRAGSDRLSGGRGRDRLSGGDGGDRLSGERGADRLRGGTGSDRLFGGKGADLLSGGPGADHLTGGPGRDRIFGGAGRDIVRAIDGTSDLVNCGPGRDRAHVDRIDRVRGCESTIRPSLRTSEPMPSFSLPGWSDAEWSDPSAYRTIQAGDFDGDGADELIGRGPNGIEAFDFDRTTGQWLPLYRQPSPALADKDGWNQHAYYSTIQLADVDGDGTDELLARASDGLHVWKFNPSSATWSGLPTLTNLSDDHGWDSSRAYYGTIQAANLIGSPAEEVTARGGSGMIVWALENGHWKELVRGGPFSDLDGWNHPEYFSTIQTDPGLLDTADSYEVLWARGATGIRFYTLADGDWVRQSRPMTEFGDGSQSGDWTNPKAYSTIQAWVNPFGDGASYIVGRSSNAFLGLSVYKANQTRIRENAFSWDAGWGNAPYGSTIQTADVDGDGRDEILGRAAAGVVIYEAGSAAQCGAGSCLKKVGQTATGFSDGANWDSDRYYPTIQLVDPGGSEPRMLVGRGVSGISTFRQSQAGSWRDPSASFPTFSGAHQQAYLAISNALAGPGTDLRAAYPDWSAGSFTNARTTLAALNPPAGITESDWSDVRSAIDGELQNGFRVAEWFDGYLRPLTQEIFTIQGMDATAELIKLDTSRSNAIEVRQWAIMSGVVQGMTKALAVAVPELTIASSLVGAALSSGIGAPRIDRGIDGITVRYTDLRSQLQGDFQSALRGLGEAREEINGNYGLQVAVGDRLIRNGVWRKMTAGQTASAEAGAGRAYSVRAWQTLAPEVWQVSQFAGSSGSRKFYCDALAACVYDVDGYGWALSRGTNRGGFGGMVNPALRNQLFGMTSAECLQAWQFSSCNLGVPLSDVFRGTRGWASLPLYVCDAVFVRNWSELCERRR